jgi:hypothetical protein
MSQAIIGISPDTVRTSTQGAEFKLGTRGGYDHPTEGYKEFIYVKAAEAITAAGYGCVFIKPDSVEMADTTATTPGTKGPGARFGVAMAAIALNGFGWLQIYGKGSLRTLASAAVGTRLNTTATPGALDDDGTAGSESIFGVSLGTATGGAEATNTDAYFSYPVVGVTL